MKVTFDQVNAILKTLPTGYYLTRKADVVLTMEAKTYAAVLDDKIFIGFPLIAHALADLPDTLDLDTVEEAVRCLLYHEVSHLFMTPTELGMSKRVNAMEDERIETLLRKYYMKVNFKKFVKLVNGGDGGDDRPEDAFMAFYRLVRFRNYRWCPEHAEERLAEVSRIISDFANMGRNSGSYICDGYVHRIDSLYGAVAKDMDEEAKKEESKSDESKSEKAGGDGDGEGADEGTDGDTGSDGEKKDGKSKAGKDKKESGEKDKDETDKGEDGGKIDEEDGEEEGRDEAEGDGEGGKGDGDKEEKDGDDTGHAGGEGDKEGSKEDDGETGEEGGEEGDGGSAGDGAGDGDDGDEGESDGPVGRPEGGRCGEPHDEEDETDEDDPTATDATIDRKTVEKLVTKMFNEYKMDSKTYVRLERIFKAAEKKRANHSGASNAYSGHLDPRQVAIREDYRWWLHRNPNGSHRRFAKTHLTLFVDVSGSFSSAESKLNQLVKSLLAIKRGNKTFDFDIIAMGDTNRMFDVDSGDKLRCCEGNWFGNDVVTLARKCRKSDAENYQLVVFDGDAMSCDGASTSKRNSWREENMAAWKVFDDPHTVVVTDTWNTSYLEKAKVTRAKVVAVSSGYAEKFIENVVKLLEQVIGA